MAPASSHPCIQVEMADGPLKKNLIFGVLDEMRLLRHVQFVHGDIKAPKISGTTNVHLLLATHLIFVRGEQGSFTFLFESFEV
jgi:hypothetical protein